MRRGESPLHPGRHPRAPVREGLLEGPRIPQGGLHGPDTRQDTFALPLNKRRLNGVDQHVVDLLRGEIQTGLRQFESSAGVRLSRTDRLVAASRR
ncbi:hypothetical protein CFP71_19085 [Amycolatopsis thailandensis]|uniref:Uncharacterized protein n=1 Tax=Amycolatopsis thailandensis TaxID=589330 RepID=A0A229S796_9PSEU|nr:hypothetical protein CFP71_19085 [Amycolatopsis thailandensis]